MPRKSYKKKDLDKYVEENEIELIGEYDDVNGQVQVWDIATLEKIDTYSY